MAEGLEFKDHISLFEMGEWEVACGFLFCTNECAVAETWWNKVNEIQGVGVCILYKLDKQLLEDAQEELSRNALQRVSL